MPAQGNELCYERLVNYIVYNRGWQSFSWVQVIGFKIG